MMWRRGSHPSAPIHKLTVVDGNTLIAIGGLITGVVGGSAGVAAVVYALRERLGPTNGLVSQ